MLIEILEDENARWLSEWYVPPQGLARAPWDIRFPEMVSLWDMLGPTAKPFLSAVSKLNQWRATVGMVRTDFVDGKQAKLAIKALKAVRAECEDLELRVTARHVQNRVEWFERKGIRPDEYTNECKTALALIENELGQRWFTLVPLRKAEPLESLEADWAGVLDKFQSAEFDARESVYCYALDRNTACVFHSMMVLERGLKALALRLKVTKPKDWGRIIDEIETEIHKRQKLKGTKPVKARAARQRDNDLTFYAAAAKEFSYFKDAWRNHTAHGRAQYDHNDAEKIMTHVRQFMAHLATRLREVK